MTAEELGAALYPDDPETGAKIAMSMTPEKFAGYVRLVQVGDELNLWSAGLGPKPAGVIVTRARGKFRRERTP